MLRIAVPSVLQQSTVSIGMMIVQAVVNPFRYTGTRRVYNKGGKMFFYLPPIFFHFQNLRAPPQPGFAFFF